ncbi:hypothetical protein ES705_33699 [subsurface metagenome]
MENEGFCILDFPINIGLTYGELVHIREILRLEYEKTNEEKTSKIIDGMDQALNFIEDNFKEKK